MPCSGGGREEGEERERSPAPQVTTKAIMDNGWSEKKYLSDIYYLKCQLYESSLPPFILF